MIVIVFVTPRNLLNKEKLFSLKNVLKHFVIHLEKFPRVPQVKCAISCGLQCK